VWSAKRGAVFANRTLLPLTVRERAPVYAMKCGLIGFFWHS
jgi:hypothetical protein